MPMVWTHLHCLHGDVLLLRNIGKELPDPLLDRALQDIAPVRGRPNQVVQGIIDGMGCASENHAAIVILQADLGSGHRARCCYVGVGGPASIDFNRDVIFKVATIYGSWTFSKSELLEIARFMIDAKVPLEKLITHRYTLDQAVEAFRTFDGATTGKCVFVMD